MTYATTSRQAELLTLTEHLAPESGKEENNPEAIYNDLRAAGYLALTVPETYGGKGANLLDLTMCQEQLARSDANTALSVGLHLAFLGRLAEAQHRNEERIAAICRSVVNDGILTLPAAQGEQPELTVRQTPDGYIVNGRQRFNHVTLPVRYYAIYALPENQPAAYFLIERSMPGVSISASSETIGMCATALDEVAFDNICIPHSAAIEVSEIPGDAWNILPNAAVYLGIATAACDFAVEYAKNRKPNSLNKPIAELPHIQERIGLMEVDLLAARELVLGTAAAWGENRAGLEPRVAASKYIATNNAARIVDLAMRIVGGVSIYRQFPLERYYREVRSGLTTSPRNEAALTLLARAAIDGKGRI